MNRPEEEEDEKEEQEIATQKSERLLMTSDRREAENEEETRRTTKTKMRNLERWEKAKVTPTRRRSNTRRRSSEKRGQRSRRGNTAKAEHDERPWKRQESNKIMKQALVACRFETPPTLPPPTGNCSFASCVPPFPHMFGLTTHTRIRLGWPLPRRRNQQSSKA